MDCVKINVMQCRGGACESTAFTLRPRFIRMGIDAPTSAGLSAGFRHFTCNSAVSMLHVLRSRNVNSICSAWNSNTRKAGMYFVKCHLMVLWSLRSDFIQTAWMLSMDVSIFSSC